jgi:K+-transporting ATPase ATPase C chain
VSSLVSSLRMLLVLSIVTGMAYPLLVTGIARVTMPARAAGSAIERHGVVVGSRLVGQRFTRPGYFWGRPSATGFPYDGRPSSGSNLGPLNPAWLDSVASRVAALRAADSTLVGPVPVDLVTASASGLDPHVSVAGALAQVPRVARARGVDPDSVRALVTRMTRPAPPLGLGVATVNVLELNLALDAGGAQ